MSEECPIQAIIKENINVYNPVIISEVFTKL